MAIDFDKINRSVDLEGLRKDVENASENGTGDFPTIPAHQIGKLLVVLEGHIHAAVQSVQPSHGGLDHPAIILGAVDHP